MNEKETKATIDNREVTEAQEQTKLEDLSPEKQVEVLEQEIKNAENKAVYLSGMLEQLKKSNVEKPKK